jgi:hypothetical protein
MKKFARLLIPVILGTIMFFGVTTVFAAPWVYPDDEPSPTTTEYWLVKVTGGTNVVNLVLWNHNNNKDFVNGKFVIAITSGTVTIDDVTVNGVSETIDDQGIGQPAGITPPAGIFPCVWEQYLVPDLDDWDSPDGWQGAGDGSGVPIQVTMTIGGNPLISTVYFLAYGYDVQPNGNLQETTSPFSHITQTYDPPVGTIPEVPIGTILASGSMMAAVVVYSLVRKRKIL